MYRRLRGKTFGMDMGDRETDRWGEGENNCYRLYKNPDLFYETSNSNQEEEVFSSTRRSNTMEDAWRWTSQGDGPTEDYLNWCTYHPQQNRTVLYTRWKNSDEGTKDSNTGIRCPLLSLLNENWRVNRALDPRGTRNSAHLQVTRICQKFFSMSICMHNNDQGHFHCNPNCRDDKNWQNPFQKMKNFVLSTPHTPWAGQPFQNCMQETTTGARCRTTVEGNRTGHLYYAAAQETKRLKNFPTPVHCLALVELNSNKITEETTAFFFPIIWGTWGKSDKEKRDINGERDKKVRNSNVLTKTDNGETGKGTVTKTIETQRLSR
jgi:hypothetical protein